MNRKVVSLAAGLALLVSPALAACGSGSSGGVGSKSVTIGMISPTSGPFADNGRMAVDGAQLAVKQINDAGGIKALDGAKINLVVRDTGSASPAQVANIGQSLVQQEKPSAIVGAWASSYSLAVSTVLERDKVPLVTESFADELVQRGYQYLFKLPANAAIMGKKGVEDVLELAKTANYPIKSAAMIADNTSSAKVSAQAAATVLKARGVKVPVEDYFAPGLTTGQSIALKVMSSHPDLIYLNADLSDTALVQKALHQQGYRGPYFGSGGGFVTTQYGSTLGDLSNGTFTTAGWNWDMPYPAAKKFVKEFEAAHPDAPFPTQEAGEDYTAVYLIADAMEKAKSSDPTKVRDALAATDATSGPGSIMPGGKVQFDKTGLNVGTPVLVVQWQDGKPHTVFPTDIAQTKATFNFS